ncbi:MAG: hypothetical protein SGJ11_09035 [Phycisphaerae bacterium]|mgnify:CR=1 FL=1|nr:hypothetical protein [Phycisphaerae bacterium]
MIDALRLWRAQGQDALIALRRSAAKDELWHARTLHSLAAHADEAMLLATCERFEAYVLADRPDQAARALPLNVPCCDFLSGTDAARHLLRVAAGLESRILGETHILGQVAAAARMAASAGSIHVHLARLAHHALRAGRRVRAETELGRLSGSYVQSAVRAASGTRIAVIGSGAMARETVLALCAADVRDVIVLARHAARADEMLGSMAKVVALTELRSVLPTLDAVILATSSPRAVIFATDIAARSNPLLLVDLGVPANVAEDVRTLRNVSVLSLADLAGPRHADSVIAAAELIVESELDRMLASRARRQGVVA